jgi:hypothetical protein
MNKNRKRLSALFCIFLLLAAAVPAQSTQLGGITVISPDELEDALSQIPEFQNLYEAIHRNRSRLVVRQTVKISLVTAFLGAYIGGTVGWLGNEELSDAMNGAIIGAGAGGLAGALPGYFLWRRSIPETLPEHTYYFHEATREIVNARVADDLYARWEDAGAVRRDFFVTEMLNVTVQFIRPGLWVSDSTAIREHLRSIGWLAGTEIISPYYAIEEVGSELDIYPIPSSEYQRLRGR